MSRRRHINADPGERGLRARVSAAAAPLRRIAWAVEDRLVFGGGEAVRGVADAARWPFERLAWLVERRLVWPLRERTAGRASPGRAGVGALAAVAIGAVLVGAVVVSGGGGKESAAPARLANAVPPAEPAPQEPKGAALQGVPPSFGVGKGVGSAKQAGGASSDQVASETGAVAGSAEEAEAGAGEPAEGAATTSNAKPVPAGPAAMKVAHRFSEAFVFYEIGERPARAKAVFGETATPQLAESLAERPPRLPANAQVPKARVVNLVPGPRRGEAYTVSVSLLRVGLTSELRLEMKRSDGAWLVTDVRG